MPARAKSKKELRGLESQLKELKMKKAVEHYLAELQKPKNEQMSLRGVATHHRVPHSTLSDRVNGRQSIRVFNRLKRSLSQGEEEALLEFVLRSADQGLPLTHDGVGVAATQILEARVGKGKAKLGVNWVDNFILRNRDVLSTHWCKPLDRKRAQALSPEIVDAWFKLVDTILRPKDGDAIRPEDIYGMDESGFPPQDTQSLRVIGRRNLKHQHKQGKENRENITILVTICADGTTTKPLAIFKGKNVQRAWAENNVSGAAITATLTGWTNGEVGLEYLKIFEKETWEKAAGRFQVLLLDGHNSHHTPEFLRFALEHKIIILGYPPHCTHALQGLDVACFAHMKAVWGEHVRLFDELHSKGVCKADFLGVWGSAYIKAFTPELVHAAFRRTGIHPFNPNVITARQMAPSQTTSTKGVFPMPQPSPVKAIVAAAAAFTRQDEAEVDSFVPAPTNPDNAQQPPCPTDAGPPILRQNTLALRDALAGTRSGSFLVGSAPFTSACTLPELPSEVPPPMPEPNWSLLKVRDCCG